MVLVMADTVQRIFIFLLMLSINSCNGLPSSSSSLELDPPQGNSLMIKSRTQKGEYLYNCINRNWVPVSARAALVNLTVTDSTTVVGNYSLSFADGKQRNGYAGVWSLHNDDADSTESGSPTSTVAGTEIEKVPQGLSIPEVLAEASFHEHYGAAYQVSYIRRLNTKGGVPPRKSCSENSTIAIPFEADFWFYTQDPIPPWVPAAIVVPSGRMVEGFFCAGPIIYSFDGSQWQKKSMHGKLYNVPGGDEFGSFYMLDKADDRGGQFCLQTANPNGWQLVGKIAGTPVKISDDSLPWSLFTVTSSAGNVWVVGPFRYYQMISTRGGIPPKPSNATKRGDSWEGRFSAQLWIYA